MLMLSIILLLLVIIAAVFAFGMVETSAVGTFRIVFYFMLILFLATLVVGLYKQTTQTTSPPPVTPERTP
jgi:uncharacterized membrane protein YtjA (UPF0391 family)